MKIYCTTIQELAYRQIRYCTDDDEDVFIVLHPIELEEDDDEKGIQEMVCDLGIRFASFDGAPETYLDQCELALRLARSSGA